jgi:hypothetical protein
MSPMIDSVREVMKNPMRRRDSRVLPVDASS